MTAPVRPNILFLQADQLSYSAVGAFGCREVRTPNLDRLIGRGVSFDLSYSANPICCPARSTWYTGRTACETGVVKNDYPMVSNIPDLGQWLRPRAVEPVYIGKWHVPGRDVRASFTVLNDGFRYGEHADDAIARAAQGFLRNYRGENPFFLSVGLIQPHDIYAWRQLNGHCIAEVPYHGLLERLPPALPNRAADSREPDKVKNGWFARLRGEWSELHWRYYLWAYHRCVEMLDAQVGRILDALDHSAFARNTVVIVSSDHGDNMGAHGLFSKEVLYEESVRVPMVIAWPGHIPEGIRDRTHLVSGLDLTPTVCDFAGVEPPPKARGLSLRPLAEQKPVPWRDALVSECAITGRMVRTPAYKLITYRGDPSEQLFDMNADPLEMKNLAGQPALAGTVTELKRWLMDWERRLDPAPMPNLSAVVPSWPH
jgi:choline-sulfatase